MPWTQSKSLQMITCRDTPLFMPDSNCNSVPIQYHQPPIQQPFQGVNDSDSTRYKLEGVHSAVTASK